MRVFEYIAIIQEQLSFDQDSLPWCDYFFPPAPAITLSESWYPSCVTAPPSGKMTTISVSTEYNSYHFISSLVPYYQTSTPCQHMISMSHGEIISRAAAFFYVLFSSPMYIEIRAGDGCVRKDLFFFYFWYNE